MHHPPPASPAPTGSSPPPQPATVWTAWPLPPQFSVNWPALLKPPHLGPGAAACLGRSPGGPAPRGAYRTAGARDRWTLGRGLAHQRLRASVHTPRQTQGGSWGGDGILWGLEDLMEVVAAGASSRCIIDFSQNVLSGVKSQNKVTLHVI